MNIKNFETEITNTILKRGRDYFRRGYVVNMYEKSDMNWRAEVEGTYRYMVAVELNEVEEIIDSSCNCPYDWGKYCKHEAAVLFALKEALSGQSKNSKKETKTLKQHLQTKSKEELVQLILNLSSNNHQLNSELLYEDNQPKTNVKSIEENIICHIENAKENGFINYNKVLEALEGVYMALDQVKELIKASEFERALDLSLVSLRHTLVMLSYADDSSGETASVIEDGLSLIDELVQKGVSNWSRIEKNTIFSRIITKATDEQLNDRTDWRIHLLTTSVYFCPDPKLRVQLNKILESFLEQMKSDSWEDKYKRGKLKAIQLKIISQSNNSAAIEQFMLDNLVDSNIRSQAILYSLENTHFQQVLHLKIDRGI